jgi:hypothetical protein
MTLEHELHEALAKIAGLEEWVENLQLDRAGFKATAGVLAAELRKAEARIAVLEAAVRANHEWHRAYDEHGGYAQSGLDQTNLAALYAQADPERDQKIADWHEGRAGLDQELHEYLGLSWAEYAQWANPRPRMTPSENPTMTEKTPVYIALLEHLDHLLDHLLPLASEDGAVQIVAAALITVKTLRDLALIDAYEVDHLNTRIRQSFEAHTPGSSGLFDDQPPE